MVRDMIIFICLLAGTGRVVYSGEFYVFEEGTCCFIGIVKFEGSSVI